MTKNTIYPYFSLISTGNQCLFFLGTQHTFDPNNTQFKGLKKYWHQFLKKTQNSKKIVFVEGGIRPVDSIKSDKEAITQYGENGLITYFAFQSGIDVISPEPGFENEIMQLNDFSKKEAMYYYFARIVHQWQRIIEKPPLDEYLGGFAKRYEDITNWDDFDFSLDFFAKLHDQLHNHKFNQDKCTCFYDDSNPSKNLVAATVSHYRDLYLLAQILKNWYEGKSIFAVYGSGHEEKLRPILHELLS